MGEKAMAVIAQAPKAHSQGRSLDLELLFRKGAEAWCCGWFRLFLLMFSVEN
jgi:hypothetical protein